MAAKSPSDVKDNDIKYFLAYFLTWLTGIIFYFVAGNKDKRMKFHALQALFIGVIQIIISMFFGILLLGIVGNVINILLVLYAWYIGFRASGGVDIDVPYISKYARKYSKY
jgi:uncharacterized membrane protein